MTNGVLLTAGERGNAVWKVVRAMPGPTEPVALCILRLAEGMGWVARRILMMIRNRREVMTRLSQVAELETQAK
jgi:hypothetical protein